MFTFDSLDDLQKFMHERSAAAQAAMLQEQRALTWGSYVMMPVTDYIIFGYVFTEEEVRLGEIEAGASQEEAEESVRTIRGGLNRGYLFGRWYSPVEPTGELGTNHAVSCWPITPLCFGMAATFDWDARQIVRAPEGEWLMMDYIAFATATAHRG